MLDPFCGCGTALNVAERLKRRWIGIDITHLAITLIKKSDCTTASVRTWPLMRSSASPPTFSAPRPWP